MSVFQPPQYSSSYNQNVAMQPVNSTSSGSGQAPPSPVKGLGYVGDGGGAGGGSGLNGYVGEKPAIREEPQNPQSLRRHTNLASPDPALSQNAFTQSQFTTNISAAAVQAQNMRNNNNNTTTTANNTTNSSSGSSDLRRDRLRQYKQSTGGGNCSGGSCGFTPHPSFNNRVSSAGPKPVNSRGPRETSLQPSFTSTTNSNTNNNTNNNTSNTSNSNTGNSNTSNNFQNFGSEAASTAEPATTIVAYTLADPGSMYKTFSGSNTWFRVMHLIVPSGKVAKRVHVAAMMVPTITSTANEENAEGVEESNNNASPGTYGLRIVDNNGASLFSRFDCDNTENFQVFTLDLAGTASGLLELQAQNGNGFPILFSSAIIEF